MVSGSSYVSLEIGISVIGLPVVSKVGSRKRLYSCLCGSPEVVGACSQHCPVSREPFAFHHEHHVQELALHPESVETRQQCRAVSK